MLTSLKSSLITLAIASIMTTQALASQADIDTEIDSYIATFKANDHAAEKQVMAKLVWAGYSSEKLYDVIADELELVKNDKDKASKKQASWYAKTLSMAGNDKYVSLLEVVAKNSNNKNTLNDRCKILKNIKCGIKLFLPV